MGNALQIFDNPEFGKVRAALIDGEPCFSAEDIAVALGYKDVHKTLATFFGKEALEEFLKKVDYDFEKSDDWYLKNCPEIKVLLTKESGVRLLINNTDLPEEEKNSFKYWIILDVFVSLLGSVEKFTDYSIKNPEVMIRFFQDYGEYLNSNQYQEDQFKAYLQLITDKFAESRLAAQSTPTLSCVYVLEMSNGTVKIGYSRNVEKRMRNISTGSGLEILNHYETELIDSEIAYSVEQECHDAFDTQRIKGEFFNITFDEACDKLKEIFSKKIGK